MLTTTTVEKLRSMKLTTLARYFEKQLTDPNVSALSFEERFGILVDIEWTTRRNNRLKRLIRSAGYSDPNAALENIDYVQDYLDGENERLFFDLDFALYLTGNYSAMTTTQVIDSMLGVFRKGLT